VHFLHFIHGIVKKAVRFQVSGGYTNYKPFNINGLIICLKNRQTAEVGEKQGEFGDMENFSAKLSTETVDRLSLAPMP
jgi:hypothetical protein